MIQSSLKIRLSNRGGCLLLMVSVNLHRKDIKVSNCVIFFKRSLLFQGQGKYSSCYFERSTGLVRILSGFVVLAVVEKHQTN